MALLIIGLAVFIGVHLFTALARDARGKMIARIGEQGFKGLFSLLSLAGLVIIILGWRSADPTVLYTPPHWLRHLTLGLMLFAIILLVAAYAPSGRIAAAVKHPMLAAVKIWAFAHLLSNGEVRSALLFGSLLAFAVIDRIAVKRRNAPVPIAGPVRNDMIAVVVGLGVYVVIYLWAHRWIAGVPLSG